MNYCQSGHKWDAQQKQANLGQKRRCGRQWLEGLTNRPDLPKHSHISQRKAPNEDAKIFMAKWDIKDGFWRMDCKKGEEYNFAYVLNAS